ncbi:MAG: hypothetical protein R3E31_08040 [Chloroflexota bacterium]
MSRKAEEDGDPTAVSRNGRWVLPPHDHAYGRAEMYGRYSV